LGFDHGQEGLQEVQECCHVRCAVDVSTKTKLRVYP
jgi:hypothetical protein